MSSLEKTLLLINFAIYSLLAVFSYSQVDLNLTISKNPLVLNFVSFMQQIGYYNRPLSSIIYILFIITAFSFFAYNLLLFHKSKIGLRYLKFSLALNTLVLIFAYPFLSADIFNYLFDAKIILKYHASPYTHKPLDFPADEWLRFMRWTHRFSPYGPIWLLGSLVPYLLGFGKFILTLFTFKIFIAFFHILNSFLIYKILLTLDNKKALFGTAFYALNPLLLIEGVANGHNDVVQASFFLLPILLIIYSKRLPAFLTLLLGAMIKYLSVMLLPLFIADVIFRKKLRILILATLIIILVFTVIYSSFGIKVPFVNSGSTQVQFQPWYLFWSLPLIAILNYIPLTLLTLALAFGASLRYLPYLYYGDWSHAGTILFMEIITLTPLICLALFLLLKKLKLLIKTDEVA